MAYSGMLVLILAWSIFSTWMFNNTKGSLLLVAVLHGSEIWLAYLMMSTGISTNNLDNYWGYGTVMVLVATVMVMVTGPENLSRTGKRIAYQQNHG
jgi:hypothetical protein